MQPISFYIYQCMSDVHHSIKCMMLCYRQNIQMSAAVADRLLRKRDWSEVRRLRNYFICQRFEFF